MRHVIYIILLALPISLPAQQIFTSEFAPYEMRQDAEKRERTRVEYYAPFSPSASQNGSYSESLTLPEKWSGRVIILHLEGVSSAYELLINGEKALSNSDHLTPTNIEITKYLREGENRFEIKEMERGMISTTTAPDRAKFEGSYLSAQPRMRISDFKVALSPDKKIQEARLNIAIALKNDFSQEQSVDVGYDIYDPSGKLLDFSVNSFQVAAKGCDTIRFSPIIYGTSLNRWSVETPKLYSVMLYTRRNDVITEYIPLKVPYLDLKYDGKNLFNFSTKLEIKSERYSAASNKSETLKDLRALKAKGINTIQLSYPQPQWLYEACEEAGVWVIDQPNINSSHESENKKIGGTPANDPVLKDEYLRRAKSAYSRSRNFASVVAYSLGGEESGNGYNMYKAYEWMKDTDTQRPIIYIGARGEWNSDMLE